jgi:hypothetical protein
MIVEQFNSRALANMEVALEQACKLLPAGAEQHENRRYIATRILECAKGGGTGFGPLLAAATQAANELRARGMRAKGSRLKAQKR